MSGITCTCSTLVKPAPLPPVLAGGAAPQVPPADPQTAAMAVVARPATNLPARPTPAPAAAPSLGTWPPPVTMPESTINWSEWGLLPPWLASPLGAPRTTLVRDPIWGEVLWPQR